MVLDPRAAADPESPLLFPDASSNVADAFEEAWDEDVLAGSDVVARVTVRHQRVAPLRSGPRRCSPSPAATARSRCGRRRRSRSPCGIRSANASASRRTGSAWWRRTSVVGSAPSRKPSRVRGDRRRGGRLGAPVAWVPSRSESMVSLTHGRAQVHEVELGATREQAPRRSPRGHRVRPGAYRSPRTWRTRLRSMLSGVCRIPRIAARGVGGDDDTSGRSVPGGRPSRVRLSIERAVDVLAAEARHGSGRVRRRNLVPNYRFPFTTAVGSTYDVGDYERALDEALRLAGVEQRRREQASGAPPATVARSGSGSRPTWSAPGPPGRSSRRSRSRRTARRPHGSGPPPPEGHETAFAQIISGVLGIEVARITWSIRTPPPSSGARARSRRGRCRSAGRRCSRRRARSSNGHASSPRRSSRRPRRTSCRPTAGSASPGRRRRRSRGAISSAASDGSLSRERGASSRS